MYIEVCGTHIVVLVLLLLIKVIDSNIIYKELSYLGCQDQNLQTNVHFFFHFSSNLIKFFTSFSMLKKKKV